MRRDRDAGFDGAGCDIDDVELGLVHVRGEEERSVGRQGDPLNGFRDGNHCDDLAGSEIEHGDGASGDVGGIAVEAIGRDDEHVRFGSAGGDGAHGREGTRVDDSDGMIELGGDVEEAVDGVEDSLVRSHAVAEIDDVDDPVGQEINNEDLLAVGAGLADAGVAVDGKEGGAAVGRGGDFMAGDALFRDDGDLFAAGGVDQAESAGELVGGEEDSCCRSRWWLRYGDASQHEGGPAGVAKWMTRGISHDFGEGIVRGVIAGRAVASGCGRRGSGRWL